MGRRLVERLAADGVPVRAVVRSGAPVPMAHGEVAEVTSLTDRDGWSSALQEVDTVVHLAARTHVLGEPGGGNIEAYRTVNVQGTTQIATVAADCGVRRFVFVSSIKVNGERTYERPFRSDDPPKPIDAYGVSKWEAEQALVEIAHRNGMEHVVVRPPLIYGPGVKGNFARMCGALERGLPLPLGAVNNRRSLVAVDNLVDALVLCSRHDAAAGGTFLVSDGEDLSTPELLQRLARAMGRRARLIPAPLALIRLGGRVLGRGAEVERLLQSLQVDIGATQEALGWSPPVAVDEGLRRAVAHA